MSYVDFCHICPNSLCQPIRLAYDGTSVLQVVLCYQLHYSPPLQERCSLRHPNTHTHTPADAEGRTPAECLSPLLLASVTAQYCGRSSHLLPERLDWKLEGGKQARCIMLLFSVGLSCVKCFGCCQSFWCYLGN